MSDQLLFGRFCEKTIWVPGSYDKWRPVLQVWKPDLFPMGIRVEFNSGASLILTQRKGVMSISKNVPATKKTKTGLQMKSKKFKYNARDFILRHKKHKYRVGVAIILKHHNHDFREFVCQHGAERVYEYKGLVECKLNYPH